MSSAQSDSHLIPGPSRGRLASVPLRRTRLAPSNLGATPILIALAAFSLALLSYFG
jgi:hypothetical protein